MLLFFSCWVRWYDIGCFHFYPPHSRPFWELDAFPDVEDVGTGQPTYRAMEAGSQHSWLSAHPTGRILNGIRIRDIATRTWILFSVAYVWGSMDLGFTFSFCSTRKAAEKDGQHKVSIMSDSICLWKGRVWMQMCNLSFTLWSCL